MDQKGKAVKNGNNVVPTSTVLQARAQIFQASQRPVEKEGEWVKSHYGRSKVTGRLGQRHADVLESMMYCAEKRRDTEDGCIELLVDPAKVRQRLSDKQYSHAGVLEIISELRRAVIEIVTPEMEKTGDKIVGGLIDYLVPSTKTKPNPLKNGKPRSLWRVRLGIGLIIMLDRDLHLYYDPGPIARLQHGVSQAVARHVLTHKHEPHGGWHIDTLLFAVYGENTKSSQIRNGRHRLKQDAEGLLKIGIVITDDKRVRRVKTENDISSLP